MEPATIAFILYAAAKAYKACTGKGGGHDGHGISDIPQAGGIFGALGSAVDGAADFLSHLGPHAFLEMWEKRHREKHAEASFLQNQHIDAFAGKVIATLTEDFAKTCTDKDIQKQLLALAQAIPGYWQDYCKDGSLITKACQGQNFAKLIAAVFTSEQQLPELDSKPLIAFLNWIARQKKLTVLTDNSVITYLVGELEKQIPGAFAHALSSAAATAAPAFKTTVLRLQSQALADLGEMRKEMIIGFEGIKDDLAKQKEYLAQLAGFQERLSSCQQEWQSCLSRPDAELQAEIEIALPDLEEIRGQISGLSENLGKLGQRIEGCAERIRITLDEVRSLSKAGELRHEIIFAAIKDLQGEVIGTIRHTERAILEAGERRHRELVLLLTEEAGRVSSMPFDSRSWHEQVITYAHGSVRELESVKIFALMEGKDSDGAARLSGVFVEPDASTRSISAGFPRFSSRVHDDSGRPIPSLVLRMKTLREGASSLIAARDVLLGRGPTDEDYFSDPAGQDRFVETDERIMESAGRKTGLIETHARRPVRQALDEPDQRLHILLGEPGEGKSSVLRLRVLDWVSRWLPGIQSGAATSREHPVPVLLEVREVIGAKAFDSPQAPGEPDNPLLRYLCRADGHLWRFRHGSLHDALRGGSAELLIDGIDEAFDQELRQVLIQCVHDLAASYPLARIIVSSRSGEFRHEPWLKPIGSEESESFQFHTLHPFTPAQIEVFLDHWQSAHQHSQRSAAATKTEIQELLGKNEALQALATNPFCLSLICLVGGSGGAFTTVLQLYQRAVEIFIHQWDNYRHLPKDQARIADQWKGIDLETRLGFLCRIARRMTQEGGGSLTNALPYEIVLEEFRSHFTGHDFADSEHDSRVMLTLFAERNYLLTRTGEKTFGFIHRSFLEFFTALGWHEEWKGSVQVRHADCYAEIVAPRWPNPTWRLSLQFFITMLGRAHAPLVLRHLAGARFARAGFGRSTLDAIPFYRAGSLCQAFGSHAAEVAAQSGLLRQLSEALHPWSRGVSGLPAPSMWRLPKMLRELPPFKRRQPGLEFQQQAALLLAARLWPHQAWMQPLLDRILSQAPSQEAMFKLAVVSVYQIHGPAKLSAMLKSLTQNSGQEKLDLSECRALEELPDFAGLAKLQSLSLTACKGLKGAAAFQGLAGLKELTRLDLSYCTGLQSTAPLAGLGKLQSLFLTDCTGLKDAAAFQGLAGLKELTELSLSDCSGLESTAPLAELGKLQTLSLDGCTGLKGAAAFQGLAKLNALTALDLDGCTGLESTAPLAGLGKLQTLNLAYCTGLKGAAAFQGLAGLKELSWLDLEGCTGLDAAGVRAVRGMIPQGCRMFGPRGEEVEP